MKAIDFLKRKGMVADYATTFTINGHFGQVDLAALLEEYASSKKEPKTKEVEPKADSTTADGPGGTDPNKPHGKNP